MQLIKKTMNLMSYYPEGIMLKKGAYNYPEKYINFDEFISLMESPELKEQIDKLRTYKYKSWDYNNAKRRLPVVLFNKFSCNLNTGFIEKPVSSTNTGSVEGLGENEIKPTTISGMERESAATGPVSPSPATQIRGRLCCAELTDRLPWARAPWTWR